MRFDWYPIVKRAEFEATGLISRVVTMILEARGLKEIMIAKANRFSLTVDGVFLAVGEAGRSPYVRDGLAVYQDSTGQIWLGYVVTD